VGADGCQAGGAALMPGATSQRGKEKGKEKG
jgi:hypothetical protein